MYDRREFLRHGLAAALGALLLPRDGFALAQAANPRRRITIYKSPTCDCCSKWVELVRKTGWIVDVKDEEDMNAVKDKARIPESVRSCHTAVVGRNVFEGHVPIDLVQAFMDRPRGVFGLAVPGMPIGSPGMEVPGRAAERYKVVGFYPNGRTFVYASR